MEKTIVIQSYRVVKVPGWITRCMQSVKAWAVSSGYEYLCYDDSFFEFAPNWYRQKVNNQIHLVTDYARLIAINRLLKSGYDRVIWVDADVLIFDPTHLVIPTNESHGFGLQLWLSVKPKRTKIIQHVHNAVMHFQVKNSFLKDYIATAKTIIQTTPTDALEHTAIGPSLLTSLHESSPLPLMNDCALFSPDTLHAVADGNLDLLRTLAEHHPTPITCANLCSTFNYKSDRFKVFIPDVTYNAAIDRLLATHGAIFNQFVKVRLNPSFSPVLAWK